MLGEDLLLFGFAPNFGELDPGLGYQTLGTDRSLNQLGKPFEVDVTALDLLVDDDAIKTLLAGEELVAEFTDVSADDGGFEKGALCIELGGLNSFGNFDFLLASQQRHLAHLLEIHTDGIVEDVVLGSLGGFLLGLFHAGLVVVDLIGLQDLDLEVLQDRYDVIEFVLVLDGFWQRLVDVVPSQVTLLFGKTNQEANTLVDSA